MAKFTQGPWADFGPVQDDDEDYLYYSAGRECSRSIGLQEAEANGRLMRMAPELYALAQRLLDELEENGQDESSLAVSIRTTLEYIDGPPTAPPRKITTQTIPTVGNNLAWIATVEGSSNLWKIEMTAGQSYFSLHLLESGQWKFICRHPIWSHIEKVLKEATPA
jgi:hypothetical protein